MFSAASTEKTGITRPRSAGIDPTFVLPVAAAKTAGITGARIDLASLLPVAPAETAGLTGVESTGTNLSYMLPLSLPETAGMTEARRT